VQSSAKSDRKPSQSCASRNALELAELDHHVDIDRIERFDHFYVGEGALDALAERVVVADEQCRRHALREVERVGDVDEDLAAQVGGAGGVQRVERSVTPFPF
jgi:hypothetical protein